jgi:hypothetical protein
VINYEVKFSIIPILIKRWNQQKKIITKIQKVKEKKVKHYGLLLSFIVQCMWVNSGFLTPFNFYFFIKFNNMTFLLKKKFNYMRKK